MTWYDDYLFGQIDASTWIIIFVVFVFNIVCKWKYFEKAGENGWAAVVPFYDSYIMFKISFGSGWLFLICLIPFIGWIFAIMLNFKLAKAFGKGMGFGFGLLFLDVIFEAILAFDESIKYIGIDEKKKEA